VLNMHVDVEDVLAQAMCLYASFSVYRTIQTIYLMVQVAHIVVQIVLGDEYHLALGTLRCSICLAFLK